MHIYREKHNAIQITLIKSNLLQAIVECVFLPSQTKKE